MSTALACQRHLFDMPRDVAFLDAASCGPLPRATVRLGREALERKARPWALPKELQREQCEAARVSAAALIGAAAHDVAIIPSIAYGVAAAAKALALPAGARVLCLADDHSSPVLEWSARPTGERASIRTVQPGPDGDWTAVLQEAVEEEAANGLALVSVSSVHWANGGLVDLQRVRPAIERAGAALLVDATHAVGVVAQDVARLDPDFLVFPTYKWLLGPFGRAFLYVAKRRQGAVPLEQTMSGRRHVRAEDDVYFTDLDYVDGARRFDMGERDFYVSLDMARASMNRVQGWGTPAVGARLLRLTRHLANRIEGAGLPVAMPDEAVRAPHILSLAFPHGHPATLDAALARHGVHAARRLGRLRVSPHVYNDEADMDRLFAALREALDA